MAITLPDARQLSDDAIQVLRLRALRGLELGYTQLQLADILGVCHETICRWSTAYHADGLEALPGKRSGRPSGSGRLLTDAQAQAIRAKIDHGPPETAGLPHALWTRKAVRELILTEFDINLAERTVGLYLSRWGYTSKKPTRQSQKQDPDAVEEWLDQTYPAIEAEAFKENAEILWVDEVGVEADHHPGTGYAPRGERATMEVPSSHIRVNQISALSHEGTMRFMTYKGMLTAEVFLVFLQRVIAGSTRPVFVIADQLPAHKTPAVEAWLEEHQEAIAVFDLPAYSPEMNPVEYLNNDMKGSVNASGLPPDRETLRGRMYSFMQRLAKVPSHVVNYFLHPRMQYAAPVKLN